MATQLPLLLLQRVEKESGKPWSASSFTFLQLGVRFQQDGSAQTKNLDSLHSIYRKQPRKYQAPSKLVSGLASSPKFVKQSLTFANSLSPRQPSPTSTQKKNTENSGRLAGAQPIRTPSINMIKRYRACEMQFSMVDIISGTPS